MFKHFIITRFNIRLLNGVRINANGIETVADKNGSLVQTEAWLKNRFDLFETICLPSVIQQSTDNFHWIVLFDKNTDPQLMEKIQRYTEQCPQFKPHYLEALNHAEFLEALKQILSSYLVAEDQFVITTRLDNDDAIHEEMIESIQDCFPRENCFLNFPCGYQYDMLNEKLYVYSRNCNHYISRVEKTHEDYRTVMEITHVKAYMLTDVYNVGEDDEPMWIETIHDNNVMNVIKDDAMPVDIQLINQFFPSS